MFEKLDMRKLSQKELRILFEAMDNYYNDIMIDKTNEYSINESKEVNNFIYRIEMAYLNSRVAERELKWKAKTIA